MDEILHFRKVLRTEENKKPKKEGNYITDIGVLGNMKGINFCMQTPNKVNTKYGDKYIIVYPEWWLEEVVINWTVKKIN